MGGADRLSPQGGAAHPGQGAQVRPHRAMGRDPCGSAAGASVRGAGEEIQVPGRGGPQPGRLRERVGGNRRQRGAAVPGELQRLGPHQPRPVHGGGTLPGLRRPPAQAGIAGGARGWEGHRRRSGPGHRGGARFLCRASSPWPEHTHRARSRHRGSDPQGSDRPAPLPPGRRARLPHPGPGGGLAVRRRGPAHPAGHPDRFPADRRSVRAGRAQHRTAPAGQRTPARHPPRPPRPRQHRAGGGARRRHHPRRRPRGRPRAPGRPLRRRGGGGGDRGRRPGPLHLPDRALPARRAADSRPAGAAPRRPGQAHPRRRRPRQQPQEPHGGLSRSACSWR